MKPKEGLENKIFEELEEIVQDRSHGSSWILSRTIKLLKKVEVEKRAEVCERIASSHPAMAGLKALSLAIAKNPLFDAEAKVSEANSKTSKNLRKLVKGKTVTTLSRSHIVENGLLGAKEILVLESLPGGEGKDVAEWLRSRGFVNVKLFCDASMGSAVKKSDLVVVGADSILETGFINKIGSLPLALISNHFAKPFVVASPCYKFLDKSESFDETLFEFVPLKLVKFIIWENGLVDLEENGLNDLKKASKSFFRD